MDCSAAWMEPCVLAICLAGRAAMSMGGVASVLKTLPSCVRSQTRAQIIQITAAKLIVPDMTGFAPVHIWSSITWVLACGKISVLMNRKINAMAIE